MSIFRVDSDLPTQSKIKLLNDMILELNGSVQQGKFDTNEIDQLFGSLPVKRRYLREVGIGNTASTYTSWSHIQAESGYSIWKFTPSNYKYSSLNKLYFDNYLVENAGEASSEASLSFNKVYLYNGDSGSGFNEHTSEAATEGGSEFEINDTTTDYLYLGSSSQFSGVKFEWQTRGSNYTIVVEYWDGDSWVTMTVNDNNLEEGTNNFQSDGHISFDIPSDWIKNEVNSVENFWIRISTSSNPITTAKAYLIIPNTSVVGLLALSSTEFQNEEWKWCSFSGSLYVTIPNSGASSFEGTTYIKSSSSDINKKNFFVYNKPFKADYESVLYTNGITEVSSHGSIVDTDDVVFVDASSNSVDLDLPTATGRQGQRILVKVVDIGSSFSVTVTAQSGETIDGASTYTFSGDFGCVELIAWNGNWFKLRQI